MQGLVGGHPAAPHLQERTGQLAETGLRAALANLRVNLSYLQKVLEPARAEGTQDWFITADDETIRLHEDSVIVDAWPFDALIARARQASDRNVPSEALERRAGSRSRRS